MRKRCCQVDENDKFFYCGTTSGDVLKINMNTKLLSSYGPAKEKFSLGITDFKVRSCSSDGRVVRASATSRAVDSGLISSQVKSVTLILVFTASMLDDQHYRDSVENKPESLLVVPLGKAFSGIPPSWCGRQMAGNSEASSYSALIAFS